MAGNKSTPTWQLKTTGMHYLSVCGQGLGAAQRVLLHHRPTRRLWCRCQLGPSGDPPPTPHVAACGPPGLSARDLPGLLTRRAFPGAQGGSWLLPGQEVRDREGEEGRREGGRERGREGERAAGGLARPSGQGTPSPPDTFLGVNQGSPHTRGGGSSERRCRHTLKPRHWSSLVVQWVKGPALSLQWFGSLLWRGLDPWPGNFDVPWAWPKK